MTPNPQSPEPQSPQHAMPLDGPLDGPLEINTGDISPFLPDGGGDAGATPLPDPRFLNAGPVYDDVFPYWVPRGLVLDDWPVELRMEVAHILNPVYLELVCRAPPGIARSTGLTVVHLLWLEILDHLEFRDGAIPGPDGSPPQPASAAARTRLLARHLRLVKAKLNASALLLRIEELTYRWRQECNPFDPDDQGPPRHRFGGGLDANGLAETWRPE